MNVAAQTKPTESSGAMLTWINIGRPHILAIVFASTLTYGWIFSETHNLILPTIAVWDWFIVNFMNKATDVEEDIANNIHGAESAAKNKRWMEVIGFFMIASGLGAGLFIESEILPFRILFTLIGLAYNYKLIPRWTNGRFSPTRFKELYFFKNFGSSMLFTLSVFIYPLFGLGLQNEYAITKLLFAIAFFIPLELTYEIIYDLRDIEGDTTGKIPTYPVIHGALTAKKIIYGLLIFSALFPVIGALTEVLRLREWVVVAGVGQQLILMQLFCRKERLPNSRDAMLITWIGAAQLFAYNLWIVTGLPLGA